MNKVIAAAVIAITLLVIAGPSHAFKFSFDGVQIVTSDELNILLNETEENRLYTLWMQPSKGAQPPDSFYKLCSWAQRLPYRENVRPHEAVRECICRQTELERNWWVRDPNLIYPYEWYRIVLTAEEWRNVIARMTVVPPHVTDDSLLARQVEENARAIDRVEFDVLRLDGKTDRLATRQNEQEQEIDALQDQQRLASEITEKNSEAIVANAGHAGDLEQRLNHLNGEVDSLRQEGEQAKVARENLRGEVQTLSSEFERLPTDWRLNGDFVVTQAVESVAAFFSRIGAWLKTYAPPIIALLLVLLLVFLLAKLVVLLVKKVSNWMSARRRDQPKASSGGSQEDEFTTKVVDKKSKKEHEVRFERGTPDSKGRERVVSPWTENLILRTRALMHAQERYEKEGLPKKR